MANKNTLVMGGSAIAIAIAVAGLLYNAFVYQARKPAPVASNEPGKVAVVPGSAAPTTSAPAVKPQPAPESAPAPSRPAATTPAAKPQTPDAPKPNAPKPEAGKQAEAKPAVEPSFDVVRVEPSGEAVVAGRTDPGADVELLNKGQPVGKAKADPGGQFVIIPGSLPPGSHQLQLRTRSGDKQTLSKQAVSVSVPEKGGKDVIVALSEPDKPTVILSDTKAQQAKPPAAAAPSPTGKGEPATAARLAAPDSRPAEVARAPQAKEPPQPPAPRIGIRIVEAEQKGGFYASGIAAADARLRIYLNGAHVADVQADRNGTWSLRVERGMSPGSYDVRADVIAPATGRVVARAEVPFQYPAQVAAVPAPAPAAPPAPQKKAPPAPQEPAAAQPQPPAQAAREAAPALPRASTLTPAPADERKTPAPPAQQAPASAASPEKPATPAQADKASPPATQPPSTPPTAQTAAAKPQQPAPPPQAGTGDIKVQTAPPAHVVIERLSTATVVKGDSLWRISRTMLGRGIRYTQIYAANTDQIRNPHRIYPGQVLVVPMGKAEQPGKHGQTP